MGLFTNALYMKVRLTFLQEVLGTLPNNKDVYREFIASKAPDAETTEQEVERLGVEEVIDKGMTVFPRNAEGNAIIYDYQIKGFFKAAARACAKIEGAQTSKMTAYVKLVDTQIFIVEREIEVHKNGSMGECVRPLRAQTAQGERVSLACSESIPAGSQIEFTIKCLTPVVGKGDKKVNMQHVLQEWLDYGCCNGLGQWRNSGKGAFTFEILNENGDVIGNNDYYAE